MPLRRKFWTYDVSEGINLKKVYPSLQGDLLNCYNIMSQLTDFSGL